MAALKVGFTLYDTFDSLDVAGPFQTFTFAGISSGLDESLYIVSLLYGTDRARQCQLAMQYHPQPIFHCGDPGDTDIRDNPAMVEDRITAFEVPQALNEIRKWLMG